MMRILSKLDSCTSKLGNNFKRLVLKVRQLSTNFCKLDSTSSPKILKKAGIEKMNTKSHFPKNRALGKNRTLKILAAMLLLFFQAAVNGGAIAQVTQPSRPKLVVLIVADAFSYPLLAQCHDKFTTLGLRRIMDYGAHFTYCHYQQATNQTACGQSVIATGAHPWATGIVGDNWYDRKRNKLVSAVTSADNLANAASDNHQIIGTTIGDELKLSNARSKVYTVALKDSDALLLAGKLANNAFSWDVRTGCFVGASQYGTFIGGANKKLGSTASDLSTTLDKSSPRANQVIADFAKDLITQEGLGQDEDPDLLGMNFSATEASLGHWGPHSQSHKELIVELDQTIADFLQFLDQKIGLSDCLVVFTADHGMAPVPEYLRDKGAEAGRIDSKAFRTQLNAALASRLGKDDWIEEFEPPNLYLNLNTIDRQQRRQPDVEALTAKLVHSLPGTGEVYSAFQFFVNQVPNGPFATAVRKSYFWGRSGELYIMPKTGYIFSNDSEGTACGSPYTYDAHVPLILFGSNIRAGYYSETTSPADIAPTIATLLGINSPSLCEGRVLSESLSQTRETSRLRSSHPDRAIR